MKLSKTLRCVVPAAFGLVSAVALAAPTARASVISVQFVQGGPSLQPGQVAGVIPEDNWNLVGANFKAGSSGTTSNLLDSSGSTTAVTLTHASLDGYNTGTDTTTPNGILLHGEDKTTPPGEQSPSAPATTATYTFNNLTGPSYDLIAFLECDTAGVNADLTAGGITYYVIDQETTGTPAFLLANNTNPNSRVTGNYVEFDDVSPSNGSITLTNTSEGGGNGTAAINGFQLVVVPEPASFSLIGIAAMMTLSRRRRFGKVVVVVADRL